MQEDRRTDTEALKQSIEEKIHMIRTSVEKKSESKARNNRDLSPVESPKIMNIAPTTLALAQRVSD